MTSMLAPSRPHDHPVADSIRRRLEPISGWDWRGWAVTGWVALIAGILRFVGLGFPSGQIFDEVYYANEGQELLDHSVEWRYPTDGSGATTGPGWGDFVVHPPLGKWLIAGGIRLFGFDAFGWRFMPVVVGILSIIIITRLARRLFGSTVLGAAAGLLVALDGMHFVLSRTAILDIFVMFFVIAAFACIILDRDRRRAQWLRALREGLDPTTLGSAGRLRLTFATVPWWRLAGAALLGLGCGVKWSAIWFLPLYVGLIFFWEVGLRKTVGAQHPWRDAFLDEIGWLFAMVPVALLAYLSTWTGWFLSDDGWKRHYLSVERHLPEPPIIGALQNLWYYHVDVYRFHEHLDSGHTYQSWPWQWLLLGRPVAFYWAQNGDCGSSNCAAEILLLGTPLLWWSFIPALLALTWFGISRRDWRAWPIGLGAAAGIVPWFIYEPEQRTMFYFYALPAEPFLVLAVVYVLGCLISRPPGVSGRLSVEDRRLYGTVFAGAYLLLVALCFWYFHPIYVGDMIPYEDWLRRMWLGDRWV